MVGHRFRLEITYIKVSKYPSGQRKSVEPPEAKKKNLKENPSSFVLRILLSASPYYVSGSILADRLGMSRVGVWARITKLRQDGLTIEASQNRGYRLAGEPDKFNQFLMEAWLHKIRTKCKVFVVKSIDSTNSEAERLLANGEKGPFAVIANEQNSGRGRMGKSWYSPKGGNINLSIAFRPNLNLLKLRTFTLWQGISLAKLLRKYTGINNISVKWPNDLMVNGKKLVCMLTEASIDCENVKTMILGIGLNVNSLSSRYPKSISKVSTSLRDLNGQIFRIHEMTSKIIKTVLSNYKKCVLGLTRKELLENWDSMDALFEKNVQIKIGKKVVKGKAVGINEDGSIKIQSKNGRIKSVCSGELTVEKW